MTTVLLALLAVLAPPPFDPQAHVTEALGKARAVAYNRDKADWAAIEARARKLAAGAKDNIDLMPAYAAITFGLKDGHSMVRATSEQEASWIARYGNRRLLPDEPRRRKPVTAVGPRTEPALATVPLPGGRAVAHLIVPSVNWDGQSTSAPYGTRLFALVAGAAENSCGYVVDLRNNTGGDMMPMLSGLSALLGNGYRSATAGRDGRVTGDYAYIRGAEVRGREGNGPEVLLNRVEGWRPLPALAGKAVAVLTDDATMSSGEAVALAFKGRPNARSFGAKTFGLASSNAWVPLSDGIVLLITSSMALDRDGRSYPDGIPPDVAVPERAGGDAPLGAARDWLAQQPDCERAEPS